MRPPDRPVRLQGGGRAPRLTGPTQAAPPGQIHRHKKNVSRAGRNAYFFLLRTYIQGSNGSSVYSAVQVVSSAQNGETCSCVCVCVSVFGAPARTLCVCVRVFACVCVCVLGFLSNESWLVTFCCRSRDLVGPCLCISSGNKTSCVCVCVCNFVCNCVRFVSPVHTCVCATLFSPGPLLLPHPLCV